MKKSGAMTKTPRDKPLEQKKKGCLGETVLGVACFEVG